MSKEAALEAARPAKEAAKEVTRAAREAAMSSMSIVNGDVIRCAVRQSAKATQKYTGASWTHQRGVRRRISCTSCGKQVDASKWVVVAA